MARKYQPMSPEEKDAWFALDMYIRKNVMGYDENQGLNRAMVLKLKGLRYGQVIANNNQHKYSNYSFKTILNTYKAYIITIRNGMHGKHFSSDYNKFCYAFKIVENHIAEVYEREKRALKIKEDIQRSNANGEHIFSDVAEYKPKDKKYKFDDLW